MIALESLGSPFSRVDGDVLHFWHILVKQTSTIGRGHKDDTQTPERVTLCLNRRHQGHVKVGRV